MDATRDSSLRVNGRDRVLSFLLLATLVLTGSAESADDRATASWWNDAWTYRRELFVPAAATRGAAPFTVAVAQVPTLGCVSSSGGDLRLFGPDGKPVSFEVLSAGFEDRCEIAWNASSDTTYTLYFGNKDAAPIDSAETVQAGLTLESRELGKGTAGTYAEMEALLAASPVISGRGLWETPRLGWNPFGPSKNGIYRFVGWLDCKKDGTYRFGTNSVDASFALVDTTVVCEWPGWHGADNNNPHLGTIELTAGVHRLEYVNAFRSWGACVLAWQPPEAKTLAPIGPDAFVGYRVAECRPAETKEGPVPDFAWSLQTDLGQEARSVTSVRLQALTPGTALRWDFGDGIANTGSRVLEHVFLEDAVFSVSLTVDGKSVAQRVRAKPTHGHRGIVYEKRIKDYAAIVQGYDPKALSPAACFEMGLICHEAGLLDPAARGFQAALEKGSLPLSGDEARFVTVLVDYYRDSGRPEKALEVLDLVLEQSAPREPRKGVDDRWRPVASVQALVAKADVLLEDLDRPEDARACLEAVLEKYRKAPTDQVRWAFIRTGEIALLLGDRDKAGKILDAAENDAEWKKPRGDFEVTEGAHSINFEEVLRQSELAAALKEIESWEWERPTVLLSGLTRHLRGRVQLARKRYDRAARDFERALARDPKASFADEAIFLEGTALEALGKRDDARACFQRVVRDFPESELAPRAKEKLK